jgi:ATP-dependent exoDNAse (exonuclease V) beta subunit
VTDPAKLAHSLYALYDYLKKEYGPATCIVHEYPFNFPVPDSMKTVDGQVMKGEIDLIWQTKEGDIVVDFKNNMGDIAGLNTPGAANYAGNHYVHQLRAYRSILEKAGRSVRATLLYYDILGVVVPID